MSKVRGLVLLWIVLGGLGVMVLLAGQGAQVAAQHVAAQDGAWQPVIRYPARHDTSPALRDLEPVASNAASNETARAVPLRSLPRFEHRSQVEPLAPVFPGQSSSLTLPDPSANFEGVNNRNNLLPPDTQGDIGFDPATGNKYYVQWVNASFAVWDVTLTPTLVYGPVNGNTLWQGFGGPCETTNSGDPITLYDPLAHRWFMSQFALPGYLAPFYQCVAVSQTSDPLGPWYRYVYTFTKMNDYPKFGVWPDGYYMTINQFTDATATGAWAGVGAAVLERDKMLAGQTARMVYFDLYNVNPDFSSMLPADLDGWTPPPAGSPNTFAEVDDALSLGPVDALRLWKFHVDWTNTASSTFGAGGQPNAVLPVDAFDWLPCVPAYSLCIPQPGTTQKLDGIGDRLMYRLAYRNFGDHESLVVNHTVKADGIDRAGVRWYEVRDPGGAPVIHQQGTFAPNDGLYRWMGSLAMDRDGNIALGYSVSGASMYPSIRYTGRLATDPPGQMAQNEGIVITGTGVQTHTAGRWGDYSMMAIDPLDDCTFWYTNETIQSTGSASWQTRIAAWRFPTCALPDYGLVLQPPMSKTADPGAVITFTLPVTNVGAKTDTYTVTVSGNAWPITAPQSLGPLSTGQTVDMQITTSVPLTATGGMPDTATIALTSQGAVTVSVTTTVTTIARYRYYFPWFFQNWYPP